MRALVLGVLILALGGGAQAEKKEKGEASVKEQLRFGVKMAERGLWREALFRFRQAQRLDPQNPEVLNNVAVAHEALGLFEQALTLYRQALELDQDNKTLRRNYARFVEFYQAYKPPEPPAEGDSTGGEAAEDPPATRDSEQTEGEGRG